MAIGTSDGEYYEDRFAYLTKDWQEASDYPNPFEDVGKYTPKPLTKPQEPNDALKFWEHPSPKKVIPIRESSNTKFGVEYGGQEFESEFEAAKRVQRNYDKRNTGGGREQYKREYEHSTIPDMQKNIIEDPYGSQREQRMPPGEQHIDREHHVPLIASGILDDQGNMVAMATDYRLNIPEEYKRHLWKHEATEIPIMHDYMADGMKEQDAYNKAHDIATAVESASVRGYAARNGLDPDAYHEGYKQFFRDAAGIAREPSGVDRHPRAHTTVHGLDEAELGQKYAENVVPFPGQTKTDIDHPPMQIDVLGQGIAMHSGPGPFKRPDKGVGKVRSANENKQEGDFEAMAKLYKNNPDLYNYYRALWKQKGGENWERWQDVEEDLTFMGVIPGGFKVIEGGKGDTEE